VLIPDCPRRKLECDTRDYDATITCGCRAGEKRGCFAFGLRLDGLTRRTVKGKTDTTFAPKCRPTYLRQFLGTLSLRYDRSTVDASLTLPVRWCCSYVRDTAWHGDALPRPEFLPHFLSDAVDIPPLKVLLMLTLQRTSTRETDCQLVVRVAFKSNRPLCFSR